MTDHSMEKQAAYIVETLNEHQYEAYWVGGFVRDRVLGRPTKDIDIATSATPEQVMTLFERCKPTGIQHGTVLVIVEGMPFEVTTFRVEAGYDQYRRPSEVTFIQDIHGDLGRRDFTMNAMAMDRAGELIDPYGGQEDLKSRVLRCVGDPYIRFGEDALRMMRCIRFAAEYELKIDDWTWEALLKQASLLAHIAMERNSSELERILMGNNSGYGLHLFVEANLFRHFKAHIDVDFELLVQIEHNVITDWLESMEQPNSRFALLFLLLGASPETALATMRTLTFAHQRSTEISDILMYHEWILNELDNPVKRADLALMIKLGTLKFGMNVCVQWLQLIIVMNDWLVIRYGYQAEWQQIAATGQQWLLELPVVSLKQLHINGRELLKAGCKPGPRIGQVLGMLLEEAALGFIENDKKQLMIRAAELVAGERVPQ